MSLLEVRQREPLHQRIRRKIERRIVSGEWPPGHRIPYEHELTAEYGCARMTVNKALSALAASGRIVRRRRAGSFVAVPHLERAVMEIQDFPREAAEEGLPYRFEILSRGIATLSARGAERLGKEAGAEMLQLQCLHRINGIPVALERRSIMLDAVPEARDEAFTTLPPGSWLLERVPWTEAEHVVGAANADDGTARLLAVAPGAACLVLDRQTWRSDMLVTEVRLVHAGGRTQLVGRFRPASA